MDGMGELRRRFKDQILSTGAKVYDLDKKAEYIPIGIDRFGDVVYLDLSNTRRLIIISPYRCGMTLNTPRISEVFI